LTHHWNNFKIIITRMYKNSLFIFTNLKFKKKISTKNLICIKKKCRSRSLINPSLYQSQPWIQSWSFHEFIIIISRHLISPSNYTHLTFCLLVLICCDWPCRLRVLRVIFYLCLFLYFKNISKTYWIFFILNYFFIFLNCQK
jgi:hypothetical protein